VGIPQSGQALVDLSGGLAMRIDICRFGKVKDELVLQMIKKGEQALNIELDRKTDLVLRAGGSLNLAQFLCRYVCQKDEAVTTRKEFRTVYCDVNAAISNVQADLSTKFDKAVKFFAALDGSRDITCLRLLQELTTHKDGLLSLDRLKESKPEFTQGIDLLISQQWMEQLYQKFPDSKSYFFFDQSTFTLVIDDPKFTFYLTNLQLSQLTREVGKVIALERHKVFLCYHRQDIVWLERVRIHLAPLQKDGIIETWDDTQILVGDPKKDTLQTAIETARVAVLLVSANFLACDFIMDEQLPRLLSQAQTGGTTGGTTIIPLFIAPCFFQASALALKGIQTVNTPDRPLAKMRTVEWQETLVKLAKAIKQKFVAVP
jgi:hypothetical protein